MGMYLKLFAYGWISQLRPRNPRKCQQARNHPGLRPACAGYALQLFPVPSTQPTGYYSEPSAYDCVRLVELQLPHEVQRAYPRSAHVRKRGITSGPIHTRRHHLPQVYDAKTYHGELDGRRAQQGDRTSTSGGRKHLFSRCAPAMHLPLKKTGLVRRHRVYGLDRWADEIAIVRSRQPAIGKIT